MTASITFPRRLGNYLLVDRLGSGGMAEIFVAMALGAEQFTRLAAVKCILPQHTGKKDHVAMFIDEAKLLAAIHHPSIVQIYELGRDNDMLYIAMELVHGHDLQRVLARLNQRQCILPLELIVSIAVQIAEALDFAHNVQGIDGRPRNIVHRDVSPRNILLGYQGEVKLADFGLVKADGRAMLTEPGTLKGTFCYVAPEQARGGLVDRRADLFSLAAVIYEMATGEVLFHRNTDLDTLRAVATATLPDLLRALPSTHHALIPILKQALSVRPDDRFATAAAMATALRRLSHGVAAARNRVAAYLQEIFYDQMTMWPAKLRDYGAMARTVEAPLTRVDPLPAPVPAPLPALSFSLERRRRWRFSWLALAAALLLGAWWGHRPVVAVSVYPAFVAPPPAPTPASVWVLPGPLGASHGARRGTEARSR